SRLPGQDRSLLLRSSRWRYRWRVRLDLCLHPPVVGGRSRQGLGYWVLGVRSHIIISGDNGFGMVGINRRLLLAHLTSGFRSVLLLLFTALHALAHPIAHKWCVPHARTGLQHQRVCVLGACPGGRHLGVNGVNSFLQLLTSLWSTKFLLPDAKLLYFSPHTTSHFATPGRPVPACGAVAPAVFLIREAEV